MSQIFTFTKRMRQLLFGYDWEVVELQGAILMTAWGLWLLLPFQTFSSSSNAYRGLSLLAPEILWGVFLLVFGIIQISSIASGNIKFRRMMIFLSCLFWIFMTITVGIARPSAGLIPFTLVTSFFLAVNYIRLGIPLVDKGRAVPR